MVAAFQPLAVEQAVGKRHTAMGTGIVHRKWLILVVATEGKWSFEQHGPAQLLLREFATGRDTIPEAIQHTESGVWGCGRASFVTIPSRVKALKLPMEAEA